MAIKFADSMLRSKPTFLCSNERCLLHHLRSDEGRTLRPISYRRGTILVEQGQPVWGIYSICYGWLKVARRTVRGKVAGVDLRGPGELIGGRELLASEPAFDVYAQAVSTVQTVWIDRAYLLDLMSRFPEIARAVSRQVAQINGTVQRRLSHALHAGLEEKIAYLLSYLYQKQTFVQFWGGGASCRTIMQEFSRDALGP